MSASPLRSAPTSSTPVTTEIHKGCGRSSRSLEDLVSNVRRGGLRMTENRRAILRTLLAARSPLGLEEIRTGSHRYGGQPDFATVFRTMQQLEGIKLVTRVNLGRPSSFFELNDPHGHHEHLICEKCGTVIPVTEECPAAEMEAALAGKYGFSELRHSLEFFGRCPQEKDNCTLNGSAQKREKQAAKLRDGAAG